MSILRTYKLSHFANENKQSLVFNVVREYRDACHQISKRQWRLFFNSEKLNKMDNLKYVNSNLSERYKQNCAYQVDGQLKSYFSNRQNDFVSMVKNSSLTQEKKINLFKINRRKLWFKKEDKNFTSEDLFLARKTFKRVLKKNKKPNFSHCNMTLNKKVAQIIPADKTISVGFDYWVKFSTLKSGKPIMIPIKSNDYFNGITGELKSATQFNFKDGAFTISFIKDVPKVVLEFKTKTIAMDFGLKSLFTTEDGGMFGKKLYPILLKYDKLISKLSANLQRQGIKLKDSKKYNKLVANVRTFIKNEINRVFNRIIKLYNPQHINLERLNFQNSHLSKRLNRILQNCGRGIITKKIESIKEVYQITVELVNPAYTSQECSNCHYVSANNRKTQETFKCEYCRRSLNADVNGARITGYRSSVTELSNVFTHRKNILSKIVTLFVKRNTCLNRKANILLSENPYFKGVMAQVKQVA